MCQYAGIQQTAAVDINSIYKAWPIPWSVGLLE
jgi:hypothetical protein